MNGKHYLPRLSGLGKFVLALILISVLVVLTVRSARNNQVGVNITTNNTEEQLSSDDNGEVSQSDEVNGMSNGQQEPKSNLPATQDTRETAVNGAIDNSNLPNTGPADSLIALAGLLTLPAATTYFWQSRRQRRKASLKINTLYKQ